MLNKACLVWHGGLLPFITDLPSRTEHLKAWKLNRYPSSCTPLITSAEGEVLILSSLCAKGSVSLHENREFLLNDPRCYCHFPSGHLWVIIAKMKTDVTDVLLPHISSSRHSFWQVDVESSQLVWLLLGHTTASASGCRQAAGVSEPAPKPPRCCRGAKWTGDTCTLMHPRNASAPSPTHRVNSR